jgi:hypothetical protein
MPGVLSHVSVALGGFLLLLLVSNWKYGAAFFMGSILPDTIKFGIPAIRLQTSDFGRMMTDPLYEPLHFYTHNIFTWVFLLVFVVGVLFCFYKMNKVKFETLKFWFLFGLSFVVAIALHLVMDYFIIEPNYWT